MKPASGPAAAISSSARRSSNGARWTMTAPSVPTKLNGAGSGMKYGSDTGAPRSRPAM
jgi:hypothetical protein